MEDKHLGPVPCHHLRTKAWHVDKDKGYTYLQRTVGTEHYWCNKTLSHVGPDDHPAEADFCHNRRRCYEAWQWEKPTGV